MNNAQLRTKIVFYQHQINGQVVMGFPENFPAPAYYNKIVCVTVHEAERWSQIMRDQEASREAMIDEERERFEGEIKRNLRGHMHNQMANACNNKNRDFLRIWLERDAAMADKTRTKRESYLHAEAYEHGR